MPYFENTGRGKNFVRLSLQTIKDSLITEEELTELFIESANSYPRPSIESWKQEWSEILQWVPASIPDYKDNKESIDSILNSGKYAVHHSKIYNELYHPHYRIIKKELFENRILPKLQVQSKED